MSRRVKADDAMLAGGIINHNSDSYRLGLAQLAEWHDRCRAKRLGIKHKDISIRSVNGLRWERRKAKETK